MKYPNGDTYQGQWERHWQKEGTLFYNNGDKYTGQWKEPKNWKKGEIRGEKHGKGTHYSKQTGATKTQEWKDGKMIKEY